LAEQQAGNITRKTTGRAPEIAIYFHARPFIAATDIN